MRNLWPVQELGAGGLYIMRAHCVITISGTYDVLL